MNLQERIELLVRLGAYMSSTEPAWMAAQQRASQVNGWFVPEFITMATQQLVTNILQKPTLEAFAAKYPIQQTAQNSRTVGIVMAGNIPLVGFHDFLCVFLAGHKSLVKLSEKDQVLMEHLASVMQEWEPEMKEYLSFSTLLKNCDAYIATGSNNTSRYFEQYFGKYPNIIRRNRTSVAILTGDETPDELSLLADDIHLYFGLGCRNVTQVIVPEGYDFVPLLEAGKKYAWMAEHHKYKNNYDYNLALYILNKQYYMTNGSLLLVENPSPFSPISQLNYQIVSDLELTKSRLTGSNELQALVGRMGIPFGEAQKPAIDQFADGVDTMAFLAGIE
jgi:hypothetical protein